MSSLIKSAIKVGVSVVVVAGAVFVVGVLSPQERAGFGKRVANKWRELRGSGNTDSLEVFANAIVNTLKDSSTVSTEEKAMIKTNEVDFKNFVKQDLIDRVGIYDDLNVVANAQLNAWLRIKDNEARRKR